MATQCSAAVPAQIAREDGLYRYDDLAHHVLGIHAEDLVALRQVPVGTDLDPTQTDVAIILVGSAGRLSQKYGEFAWRLTHLGTGCAAIQLSLSRSLRCEYEILYAAAPRRPDPVNPASQPKRGRSRGSSW